MGQNISNEDRSNALSHFGVRGMKWGVRNFKNSVKQKYGNPKGGVAGAAGQAAAKAVLGKNYKNKKSVTKTSMAITKKMKSLDDGIGKAFGMKKNKAGKWVVTPEATMKATAVGVVLGFTASLAEMKIRQVVRQHEKSQGVAEAAYNAWLKNG